MLAAIDMNEPKTTLPTRSADRVPVVLTRGSDAGELLATSGR
jgi:hypothetical protein